MTTLALGAGVTQTESFDLLDVIARGREGLTPHGVWYALELDPAATPAHWVYPFFPETRAWIERHMANTFTLYNHFQAHGFSVEAKRHVFYQPVSLQMMAEIAHARPTVLQHISDEAYRAGMERLRQTRAVRARAEWRGDMAGFASGAGGMVGQKMAKMRYEYHPKE